MNYGDVFRDVVGDCPDLLRDVRDERTAELDRRWAQHKTLMDYALSCNPPLEGYGVQDFQRAHALAFLDVAERLESWIRSRLPTWPCQEMRANVFEGVRKLVINDERILKEVEQRIALYPVRRFILSVLRTLPWSKEFYIDGNEPFVQVVAQGVMKDYASGELDMRLALLAILQCVLACDRVLACDLDDGENQKFGNAALMYTLQQFKDIRPKKWTGRRPEFSTWVKCLAVTVVRVLADENPGKPLALSEHNNWTTPIFRDAAEWLVTLGVVTRPIPQRTLYSWYTQASSRQSTRARRPGRPRRDAPTV